MARLTDNGMLLALGAVGLTAAAGAFARRGSRALAPASGEALQGLLAVLRAMQTSIHEGHWVVKGSTFYGDHQLLQRLYAGGDGSPALQDEIDTLGERIVAYAGPSFVDSRVVTEKALRLIEAWQGASSDPITQALHAEESLQLALRATYDALKASGELSLGLDDFLMAMADAHDTNRYLLRQRTAGTGSAARRPVATRRTAEPPRDLSVRAFSLRHRGSR